MRCSKDLAVWLLLSHLIVMFAGAKEVNSSTVIQAQQVEWGYLNPLRGDKSPAAANLWGDRTKNMATGMLVKFNRGFSSPPHIHNISYRGVVISGLLHNDDPKAEHSWMPTGSYWTQPAGHNHITAANGKANLIYLEIDGGPYLVKLSDQHFDNGESSLNLHRDNMVWLGHLDSNLIDSNSNAQVSHLWGSTIAGNLGGSLVKLPARFKGRIEVNSKEFRAVVIQGQINYQSSETNVTSLLAGSYIDSTGKFTHQMETKDGVIVYIRQDGRYKIVSNMQ